MTTPRRAFAFLGVDYAGPVMIRSSLGRLLKLTKAWIAVFVCLVTRAIHLELVNDATTQVFMTSEIISDNETNFLGANNYLITIVSQIRENHQELENKFKIRWRFLTSGAPHHGGIYEAAVKSTKYHLIRTIRNSTLTFEEYATVLSQVEACVNSKPICVLTDDPTSLNQQLEIHLENGIGNYQDRNEFRFLVKVKIYRTGLREPRTCLRFIISNQHVTMK